MKFMNFSEKFLRLRKSAGLSQEEVADRLGVSRQAVSRWEQGSALPDALNNSCICKVFGVSADYLINSVEDARSEIKALFSDGARAESGAAVAAANRGRNKRILYACTGAHIPALAAELIAIICFICSAKTAFYVLLCLGIIISVCAVTAFEVLFSDKESDVRTFYRKKYYGVSVWLLLPLKLLIVAMAICYAAISSASGGTLPVISVTLISFAVYFVICMAVDFALSCKK